MRPNHELDLFALQRTVHAADHDLKLIATERERFVATEQRNSDSGLKPASEIRDDFNSMFVKLVTDLEGDN